jgi:hypothetical protein
MCGQLGNRSSHQLRWDICFKTNFLMLTVKMQKTNAILKVEHDLEQCAHIFQKRG